jgi:uracil-DNA glycosylase
MSAPSLKNNTTWKLISELDKEWQDILFKNLSPSDMDYINNLYNSSDGSNIYPPQEKLFEAFKYFSLSETKVVIIGQDPYPTEGYAHGLAFSVQHGVKIPRSLVNIYAELKHEYPELSNSPQLNTGNLTMWAMQGVLLINTALTVEQSKPNCHAKFWKKITDGIISDISNKTSNNVFLLWGGNAHKKMKLIDSKNHYVFKCAHPSPLSANRGNWFYNNQFRLCNIYLEKQGKSEINWLYANPNA